MILNTPELRALRRAIGARLREKRLAKGFTLTDLSRLSGIRESKIGKYEIGGRGITLELLAILAHALGGKVVDFLPGEKP